MSTPNEDYPEDEFDVSGRDRTPQGVHRRPRSLWRTLLPLIAVVVIAPLLAWGAVALVSSTGGESPGPAANPTQTAGPTGGATGTATADGGATTPGGDETPAGGEEPSDGASEEPTDETDDEESPGADVQDGASIVVLNGAGIGGLAGTAATELTAEGFTGASAADYASGAPATTTLYYNDAELLATAQRVGEILGITNLVESPGATQTVDIAIVLRADYQG